MKNQFMGFVLSGRLRQVVLFTLCLQSREEGNAQESIQSSTPPDTKHHMGK